MINKDELMYKMEAIIDYLKNNNGENYKVYNHLCPDGKNNPDSNILEYATDVKAIIEDLLNNKNSLF